MARQTGWGDPNRQRTAPPPPPRREEPPAPPGKPTAEPFTRHDKFMLVLIGAAVAIMILLALWQ